MSTALPFSLRSMAPKLHPSRTTPRLYLFAGYSLRYKSHAPNHSGKRELQTSTLYRPHGLPDGIFPFSGDLSNVAAQEVQYSPPPPPQSAQLPFAPSQASSNESSPSSLSELFANASASTEKSKPSAKLLNSRQSPSSTPSATATANPQHETPLQAPRPRRPLRPRKAAISLTPSAVTHIRSLLEGPDPRLLRIGVRNRGCSGLSYKLDYVEKSSPFDEVVEQDGVKVLIDSKALFSIIGSEMDWEDKKLCSKFVFRNPNIKHECGCGESFAV